MAEYDNTNRGAGWIGKTAKGAPAPFLRGTLNIDGDDFWLYVFPTRGDGKTRSGKTPPSHEVFIFTNDKSTFGHGALWKETKEGSKRYLKGELEVGTDNFWLSVFKNEKRTGNGPDFNFSLQPKEEQAARTEELEPEPADDFPF